MPRCSVVLNPASGGGTGDAKWRRAEAEFAPCLAAAGFELDVVRTSGPGDAAVLTRKVLEAGADVVVAAGGDGLLNEVVCGFMEYRAAAAAAGGGVGAAARGRLAVLPLGTGNDFCKTHGWAAGDAKAAAQRMVGGDAQPLDVGCLQLLGAEEAALEAAQIAAAAAAAAAAGRAPPRYFVNIASCGVGASAARRVQKLKRWPLAYELAAVSALLAWAPPCGWECSADGGPWRPVADPTVLAVGNGRFWGGGFQVCPGASTSSGRMEATVLEGYGVWGFLTKGGLLRAGKFLDLPGVTSHQLKSHLLLRPGRPSRQGPCGAPCAVAPAPGAQPDVAAAAAGEAAGPEAAPRVAGRGGAAGDSCADKWLPWEVDGEAAGEGPAIVSFVPAAIQLCV